MATKTPTVEEFSRKPLIDENIGLLRRIWRGRIWYGAEWYITTFGGLVLVLVLLMTAFAPVIAPYDPNEFVAAPFTPPGKGRQSVIARAGDNPVPAGGDLTTLFVGVQRNLNGVKVADRMEIERQRYMTEEEMLQALSSGEVDAVFMEDARAQELLAVTPEYELIAKGLGPSYLFGTDNLGRDILSRVIWGARTIMGVALSSALLSSVIGVFFGLVSGFVGGWLDRVVSLVMDSIYSFPGLLLAIAMVAMLGPGLINVAIAVSVIYVPTFFRVVRGQTLSVKQELYVEAARSLGAKSFSILTRYIFPNVIPSIVVVFSLNVADAILTEAGLSFIGLGLPPDIPDWGYDISKGHGYLVAGQWWMITFPGIMISLVASGFSLLGEGLSEILNPRLVKN
jgi:peptide/nickel transport system permease protein